MVCEHEWYGGKYTGFYVHPNVLNKESIVYSFGVGEDISFDQKVIDCHGCCVWAFDPAPKSINWVKENVIENKFIFHEYGLSSRSEMVGFYLSKNAEPVSESAYDRNNVDTTNKITVEMKSLEDILAMTKHNHIDLLKMDIEGSEYDVI